MSRRMALSTPQAPLHAAREPADSPYVISLTAPGYCVRSRALDLDSASGVAVALVHSPYALAKLEDGRYLAVRAARETEDAFVEIGLSLTSSSSDVGTWVRVIAGGTLGSLIVETIIHLWLGFFNGPAETSRGPCTTCEADRGSINLGIRHMAAKLGRGAGSSRSRSARHAILHWLAGGGTPLAAAYGAAHLRGGVHGCWKESAAGRRRWRKSKLCWCSWRSRRRTHAVSSNARVPVPLDGADRHHATGGGCSPNLLY